MLTQQQKRSIEVILVIILFFMYVFYRKNESSILLKNSVHQFTKEFEEIIDNLEKEIKYLHDSKKTYDLTDEIKKEGIVYYFETPNHGVYLQNLTPEDIHNRYNEYDFKNTIDYINNMTDNEFQQLIYAKIKGEKQFITYTDSFNMDWVFALNKFKITENYFKYKKNVTRENKEYVIFSRYIGSISKKELVSIVLPDYKVEKNEAVLSGVWYFDFKPSFLKKLALKLKNKLGMEISIYDYEKNMIYSTIKREKNIFYRKKYDLLSTGYKIEVIIPTIFSLLKKIDYLVMIFTILILYQILKKNEITKKLSDIELEESIKKYHLTHDSLTKLLNRFGVEKKLKLPYFNCGIILFDIDYFKKINDTYGHSQGDLVLKGISNILKIRVSKKYIVSRYGGEEFLVIIQNIEKNELMDLIEKIRKDIMRLELIEDRVITSSFGIFYGDLREKSDLKNALEEADEKLYKAKKMGRNRIES